METSAHLATHIKNVYYGGNWTVSNFKEILEDVSWQEATTQVYGCNTIATLVFHTSYFLHVINRVLDGGPLDGSDKLSFNHPPINNNQDWEAQIQDALTAANTMSILTAKVPNTTLWQDFSDSKYGNYFRNIQGIIEHCHYHLGQIAIIKKIVKSQ